MNNNILVSIITPCYNSEKTIENTINSVLSQSYKNIEYIIIDGKSNDSTVNIIKKYIPLFEGRLKYISEADNGIYDAMNKGISMSKGDIVGIVNSDDYYEKDAVKTIIENMTADKYQIVYGMVRNIKDGKEIMVYTKHYDNIPFNMIPHPACFVSKSIYDDFGVYSTEYKYSSDYEFMFRMYNNNKIKFKMIYNIISNFSIDGASSNSVAFLETMKLKLKYGMISKRKYKLIEYKVKLGQVCKKIKLKQVICKLWR